MTEREIPDGVGFLFGGMTDDSQPVSAPPVLSEPENAQSIAPVYGSRREARAAADAASPVAVSYDGIASLFPLLGDVTVSPVTTPLAPPSAFDAILAAPPAELGATQAIPTADVEAELATPVGPYVVPQSAPVAIVPSWHAADAFPVAPAAQTPAAQTPAAQTPAAQTPAAQTPADPFPASHRVHPALVQAAPRSKTSSRGRAADRKTSRRAPANRVPANRVADNVKPMRQRAFGVGVMVLVAGLFAVLAIPAYADNDAIAFKAAAAVQTQKVEVANAAASTIKTAARDGYTATSAADLKSMYAAAMREQNIAEYLQSGAKAKGDDYPWFAELDRAQGGGLSPLGYYYRECVDFVAWRLNRDAGTTSAPFMWTWSKLTPNGGDGHQWKAAWLAHGWPTGTTPVPGAVAWFGNNHVGYVNGILDNGQVLIEEYNYVPHAYGTRVINASDAYYLYAPPK